jgi:LuxR family transcriptional regulator
MDTQAEISQLLATLKDRAPAGYAIALHLRFTTPTFLFQSYPKEWIDYYSQNGLVMRDPTVHWGFDNTGTIRWSELRDLDADQIIAKAADHGMRHGVTVVLEAEGTRSLSSFTRGDRDFTDAEVEEIAGIVARLHQMTSQTKTLTQATRDRLRGMSITFTHP